MEHPTPTTKPQQLEDELDPEIVAMEIDEPELPQTPEVLA